MPTLKTMGARTSSFKPVLAALALGVTFCAPLAGPVLAQDSARAERLLDELQDATTPENTTRLIGQIRTEWAKSGSAAIDLLLQRGRDALAAGDAEAAIEHLTAAIDHAPGFAEAYETRANAFYLSGLTGPAIEDLRQALVLNPRHFGALKGFAILLEDMERAEDARETWKRVLDLVPGDAEAQEAADRLDMMLGGRTL